MVLNRDRKYCTFIWYLMFIRQALNYLVRLSLLLMPTWLGGLVLPLLLDKVSVRFSWYYVLWCTHGPFPARCSLHHQYSFPSLVLLLTPPFGSYTIQGGVSLMQGGSPLVDSLLNTLDFSDDFLDLSAIFWSTPTIDRI